MNIKDELKEKIRVLEQDNLILKEKNQYFEDTIDHFKKVLKIASNPIVVKEKGTIFLIPYQAVIAVVSMKECVDFYINTDVLHKINKDVRPKHKLTLKRTMRQVHEMLGGLDYFIEIKHGCIINGNYFQSIDKKGNVRLNNMKEDITFKMTNAFRKKIVASMNLNAFETALSWKRKILQ